MRIKEIIPYKPERLRLLDLGLQEAVSTDEPLYGLKGSFINEGFILGIALIRIKHAN